MFKDQTIWIVGASEGLGAALAMALDARGARLILSARNGEALSALVLRSRDAVAVPMDVTAAVSVAAAWEQAQTASHVVYCAGAYEPMSAAHWDPESVMAMVDVNFSGALRVLGHVVPSFAKRDSGEITLIGSLAGFRGLPQAIGYGASKSALMHLGENLRADLHRSGIKVRIVNPGFIRTRLTQKNSFAMPMIMEAETAAHHVVRAMTRNRFSTSFPRPFSWVFRIAPLLPEWLYFRMFGART